MKKILLLFLLATVSLQGWAEKHYLVGGCTESGWNSGEKTRSTVRAYTADGTNWAWAGYISAASDADAGRFKIPNSTDGWNGFWASAQNTVITSEGVDLSTDGTDDRKFRLAETGYYLITFNTSDMKIYAEKLTAPSQNGGYYLINSINDYYYFAAYIATDGTRNSKAKLTADLDFSGKTFIPLASEKYPFTGEFDGQCHTIKNAKVAVEYSRIGLFACVSSNANIHDLIIKNNCSFSGWAKVAGIAGHALGGGDSVGTVTLSNIINNANVTSTGGQDGNEGHTAGFIACCNGNVNLSATNCANTGDIDGQAGECAAFVGWNGTAGTSFTNCWNIGEIADEDTEVFEDTKHKRLYRGSGSITPSRCYDLGHNDQGSSFSNDDLESGKLCYLLNNAQGGTNWYQTLSGTTDATPIPFNSHKKVYKFGSADSYLNDGDNVPIETASDLDNFSTVVNAGATSLNAEVTANISANADFTPIGTSTNMYKGTFDGKGKSIELSIDNTSSSVNHCALIGYATGGATIQNLILKGSVKSSGNVTAGFIAEVNGSGEVTITNCGNEAEIRGNGSSGEVAAIIANNYGANGACALKLTNVYNVGDVYGATGTKPSTICGSQNHDDTAFKNVYNYGHVYLNGALSNRYAQFARGTLYNGNSVGSYDNCYSTILNETDIQNTQDGDSPDIKKIEDSDVSSGELTCLLNGSTNGGTNFYQILGEDTYPVLDSSHGKVWKCLCTESNAEIRYANSEIGQSTTHVFNEPNTTGYCSQCLNYNVSTGAQMKSIADGISAGTIANDIHIYFTQDIDFAGVTGYAGIGTDTDGKRFCGILDGQDHSVNNMTIDSSNSGVGIIGTAGAGADIKNFIVDNTCSVKGNQYVAGIVGSTNGNGNITITRCGNEARIQATNGSNSNAAGILGCRRGSNSIEISNCYNTGIITGINESAGICAWTGSKFIIKKCYNSGTINGEDNDQYFARFDGTWDASSTITDCYQVNVNNETAVSDKIYNKNDNNYTIKAISVDVITSGQLCCDLDNTSWYQDLSEENSHPIPFSTSKRVYCYGSTAPYWYSNIDKDASKVSIGSVKELNDFATLINSGNYSLNAELANDIAIYSGSYIGDSESHAYTGTFDGNGHKITINYNKDESKISLFKCVTGGTIQNLIVDGTINAQNSHLMGGLINESRGSSIYRNIVVAVNMTTKHSGDGTHGGVISVAWNVPTVENVAFVGSINAPKNNGSCGIIGYAHTGGSIYYRNCYVTGTLTLTGDNNRVFGRNGEYCDNCYTTLGMTKLNNADRFVGGDITSGQVKSGELCYLLNDDQSSINWYQDLSEEGYPIPFGTKTVTAGKWFNDADNDVYFNLEGGNYTVYQLNMSDTQTEYNVPANVTAKNVTITRTIPANQWIGLCLPFDYDIPSGWTVCEFDHINGSGGNAVMSFTTASSIEAGKPYLVKPETEVTSITITDTDTDIISATDAADDNTVSIGGVNMIGNLAQTSISTGDYYINKDSQLKKLTGGTATLKGFRAYFTVDSGSSVKALNFDFDEDATSINSLTPALSEGEGAIYNLAGQKLTKLQRGINIINGKKVLF